MGTHEDGALSSFLTAKPHRYRELQSQLEKQVARFRTQSDTEVILHLYRQFEFKCTERLNGMFAFVIWDERDKSLFLARDPLGIKPLYYFDDGKNFIAASQVSAFINLCQKLTPDPAGHLGFFVNGYVPDPFTMFREIKALPAGSWLCRSETRCVQQKYYCLCKIAARSTEDSADSPDFDDREGRLSQALNASVARHMISNVDVGLFLSSGADSTTIGCLAAAHASERIKAITLGAKQFENGPQDEVPLARTFAQKVGLDHMVSYVGQNEFSEELNNILTRMDQPSIDREWPRFISKIAAASGLKVVLSGLGGDELFRGYPSFTDVPRIVKLNRLFLVKNIWRILTGSGQHRYLITSHLPNMHLSLSMGIPSAKPIFCVALSIYLGS